MVSTASEHPFNRSGLAPLSDLGTPEWRSVFAQLEEEQAGFLAREAEFRSPMYKWPRDPLHTWSRAWEYPYVYFHLKRQRELLDAEPNPHLVDLGSGVTFFPFAAARLGYHVTCADIDPVCETDISRAAALVSDSPGTVDVRLITKKLLPFGTSEVDCVYCISVLEHIADFEGTIREIHRILKPRGTLLVTMDLDLRGDSAVGVDDYKKITRILVELFGFRLSETTLHPRDMLTSDTSPFSIQPQAGLRASVFSMKQILRLLMGKKRRPQTPFRLAVIGMMLQKN